MRVYPKVSTDASEVFAIRLTNLRASKVKLYAEQCHMKPEAWIEEMVEGVLADRAMRTRLAMPPHRYHERNAVSDFEDA